eukprot:UN32269
MEWSFSKYERYTQKDIAKIVEYARQRGVRVIPEFDVPGHAASWCTGYPEICPDFQCLTPLNVANNKTFDVIQSMLDEAQDLFPDNFVHLGGDEVNTACWDEHLSTWLISQNMTSKEAYSYFTDRAAKMVIAGNKRPIQWNDVYDNFGAALDKIS